MTRDFDSYCNARCLPGFYGDCLRPG